jgi:hypothetical protein
MSSDSFLEFPFDVKEFRDSDRVLQSVYVRSSYIDIFSLICESINSGTKRIVVTGTPGIGKSTFMFYFVWKFLNDAEGSLDQNRFNLYIPCTLIFRPPGAGMFFEFSHPFRGIKIYDS